MASRVEVEEFIRASFRSVWALELISLLRSQDGALSHREMVERLRASDFVIAQCLENLAAVGLVCRNEDGSAFYRPFSKELDDLVAQTEQLYGSSPNAVRRIIATATNPGIAAFSNAFRLRKDEE